MNPAKPMFRAILALTFVLCAAVSSRAQEAATPPPLPDRGSRTVSVSTVAQLQQAVSQLTSDTTIIIQPGTYRLTSTLYVGGTLRNVAIRGASGNRDDVVLVGGGMRNPSGSVPFGIWTGGASVDGVTVADLTIRDFSEHAIILNAGTQRPHLYNLRLLDVGDQFVKGNPDPAGGGVNDGILEHSIVEYTTTAPDSYSNGIDIHAGQNWIVRRNTFRNIVSPPGQPLMGPAILFWNRAGHTITEGNVLINCARGISYGLIDRPGANDHTGGSIRNNIVFRSGTQPGDVGIHVADSPDTEILNNTVVLSGTYPFAIEYRFPSTARLMLVNNLVDGTLQVRDGATATVRNNVTRVTPAMFVDLANGDLHLSPGATDAIDTGLAEARVPDDIDGRPRPAGAAYDIGADEFEPAALPAAEPGQPVPPPPAVPDAVPSVPIEDRPDRQNDIT